MTALPPAPEEVIQEAAGLLDGQALMTLAVNGADGFPWASTVAYVNDGLDLYFVSARESPRCERLAVDPRAGVAVRSSEDLADASGLAMTGRVEAVTDAGEIERINRLVVLRRRDRHAFAASSHAVAVFRFITGTISLAKVEAGRSASRRYRLETSDPPSRTAAADPG